MVASTPPRFCITPWFQKTQHHPALARQIGVSVFVPKVLRVLRAVGLDDELRADAKEVDDVRSDWDLSAELQAAQSSVAQQPPEAKLRIGRRVPHCGARWPGGTPSSVFVGKDPHPSRLLRKGGQGRSCMSLGPIEPMSHSAIVTEKLLSADSWSPHPIRRYAPPSPLRGEGARHDRMGRCYVPSWAWYRSNRRTNQG
jgi:hypothetical protein